MRRIIALPLVLFVATACGTDSPESAPDADIGVEQPGNIPPASGSPDDAAPDNPAPDDPAPDAPAPDASAPDDAAPDDPAGDEPPTDEPPADEPEPEAWVVGFGGVGPLDLGMTLDEAAAALGQESLEVSGPTPACGYVLPPATPDGIAAMIVDDHVVRIDIMEGATPTEAGARIGDSEERIRALYEGRVEEAPHKYVDGSYLTVSPPGGEGTHRILFETKGTTVTAYRTGLLPQVRWVEGCS